jgi:hypothetical protein
MPLRLILGLLLTLTASAQVSFDAPNAVKTIPIAVNDAGWVAGTYLDTAGVTHAFLRNPKGKFVAVANGKLITPTAIDAHGNMTGIVNGTNTGFYRPYRGGYSTYPFIVLRYNSKDDCAAWNSTTGGELMFPCNGTSEVISIPNANSNGATPMSLDGLGDAVGYFTDTAGMLHSFYFNHSNKQTVQIDAGPPATGGMKVLFMNAHAKNAGVWYDSSGISHSFCMAGPDQFGAFSINLDIFDTGYKGYYPTSAVTGLKTLQVNGIPNIVVGWFIDTSGATHAYWTTCNDEPTQYDYPRAVATAYTAESQQYLVAGWWEDSTGLVHGFVGPIQ